ncbi:MAG: acyltransferase [Frankiales bacterium]|nr:acyltransferase [Frankiales bacterium]
MTTATPTRRPPAARRALLGRSPALDGLRGLALIWVVTYHFTSADGPFPGGWVGLDVFFVLSGFLITAMLLDEVRTHGRVSLPMFYARRACRLLPALFVMLAIWVCLLLAFHDTTWFAATPGGTGTGNPVDVSGALGQVGITLGYGANWIYALGSGNAPLAHLWSLAVEEQFYVVWPFVVLLLVKLPAARRHWPALALAAVSATLPFLYYAGGEGTDRIYFGTDTRAVGMLLGAVAALTWHRRRASGRPSWHPTARAWAGLALVIGFLFTVGNVPLKSLAGPAIMALAAMQVIPYLADRPASRMATVLDGRVLIWLGQRSYAVYLWHYLFATWLNPLSPWVSIPVGVTASLAAAWLSWRFVEAPALEYAKRFRPAPPVAPQLTVAERRERLAA